MVSLALKPEEVEEVVVPSGPRIVFRERSVVFASDTRVCSDDGWILPYSTEDLRRPAPWRQNASVSVSHRLLYCPWRGVWSIGNTRRRYPQYFFDYSTGFDVYETPGRGFLSRLVKRVWGIRSVQIGFRFDALGSWYDEDMFAASVPEYEWVLMSEMIPLGVIVLDWDSVIPRGWRLATAAELVCSELNWLMTHGGQGEFDRTDQDVRVGNQAWMSWSSDNLASGETVVVGTLDGRIWIDRCELPRLMDEARSKASPAASDQTIGVRLVYSPQYQSKVSTECQRMGIVWGKNLEY